MVSNNSAIGEIPVPVSNGGTGAQTLTENGVLIGNGTAAVGALGAASTGQALMGVTGNTPAFTGSPSFSGSVTAGTSITASSGNITATNGNLVLSAPGNKLSILAGVVNASVGVTPPMTPNVAGSTVTVNSSAVTTSSIIIYARQTISFFYGNVSISAQTNGSFTLLSEEPEEEGTFTYWIIN